MFRWLIIGSLLGGGVYVIAKRTTAKLRTDDQIDRLIQIGVNADHSNERIPLDFVAELVQTDRGVGILTVALGVANWGVEDRGLPADPRGIGWAGRAPGLGKHLNDGRHGSTGGLSMIHAASAGFLWDIYQKWGFPDGIPADYLRDASWETIYDGPHRQAWYDWSDSLVRRPEFHRWLLTEWLRRYWDPSRRSNPNLETSAINARIRNSRSGWGTELAGRPWEEQARVYIDRKGERGERQMQHTERVGVLLRHFGRS